MVHLRMTDMVLLYRVPVEEYVLFIKAVTIILAIVIIYLVLVLLIERFCF